MSEICDGQEVHLADHFDLIAGTSAGGLIALAHGHHRLKLDDIVRFFSTGDAFSSNPINYVRGIRVLAPLAGFNRYNGRNLEKWLKVALDPQERLDGGIDGRNQRKDERNDINPQPDSKRPRVFALSSPAGSSNAGILFANYRRDEYVREAVESTDKAPLVCSSVPTWAAARATSAAPGFFPVAKFKIPEDNEVHCFWDGGLVNNSPVVEAVTQAEMIFGYDRGFELVLSVGCGQLSGDQNTESGLPGLTLRSREGNFGTGGRSLREDIINAVTNSEKEFQSAKQILMSHPRTRQQVFDRVYRINPSFPDLSIDMIETRRNRLQTARDATIAECDSELMQMQMEEIARILTERNTDNIDEELSNRLSNNEDEIVRTKALHCTRHFFPPLVRLSRNELQREGNIDDREQIEETADRWAEKYHTSIVPILDFLENTRLDPENSVKLKGLSDLAFDIERCRFTLWRCYLNRLMKRVNSLETVDLKREFLHVIGVGNILRIEESLLPLDRANALHNMKIDRKRPFCPRGIAWISKTRLEGLSEGLNLQIGEETQHHSIDQNHLLLRGLFEGSDDEEEAELANRLNILLRPFLPEWMRDYPDNEDFQRFYERWEDRFPV
eukprot:CAMPEP_0204869012 /NCGR_PEP_ID=MMETSP1348-20121228/28318_1 /ASSEMBLY_ACC=CAM_ASM_000700 /TAXON_ID=215587 /ORGANISM="Aplanochytrium stocchinoi, Strain GSBS06" /LENGTH=613 /DNA_ID=CAMNT_0052022173 /DNA_START=26 /DNA_END=1867 /DNA_ORIENTATION=+